GRGVWVVKSGWSGGAFGKGRRIPLRYPRALVNAVLAGRLDGVALRPDPVFGVQVPEACPDVPAELLRPRETWAEPGEYDQRARQLAGLFRANFEAHSAGGPDAVRPAGPRGGSGPAITGVPPPNRVPACPHTPPLPSP